MDGRRLAVKARMDMILGANDAQNSAASGWIRQLASRCDAAALCWVAREYVLVGFVVESPNATWVA